MVLEVMDYKEMEVVSKPTLSLHARNGLSNLRQVTGTLDLGSEEFPQPGFQSLPLICILDVP